MKWAYKFKVLLIGGFVVEAFDSFFFFAGKEVKGSVKGFDQIVR
jgi:hypothetical protein